MSKSTKIGAVKYGDETQSVVMRVPIEAAAAFASLVQSGERGARSRAFAKLVADAVTQEGESIDSAIFDAQKRREGGGLREWDELNARLEASDDQN